MSRFLIILIYDCLDEHQNFPYFSRILREVTARHDHEELSLSHSTIYKVRWVADKIEGHFIMSNIRAPALCLVGIFGTR